MLANLTDAPFSHPQWLFEPKLDGVRAIALIRRGEVRLLSRRGLDTTGQHPSLSQELAQHLAGELVVDGEIVALDQEGRPSFQQLQQRLNLAQEADIRQAEVQVPVIYYIFDLLYLDGYDLRAVPLEDRKFLLQRVLLPSSRVRLLEHFEEDGEAAIRLGLEGIIAKRRDSPYESGRRSRHWLKVKATLTDEFVIGGYSQGLGSRAKTFGALLLGRYDDEGRLVYVGHVGSGFDDRTLQDVRTRLHSLRTDQCPFAEKPPLKTGTAWVRPELVVEVKFAQWTREGYLRAPVFLRLREDKLAGEVSAAQIVPLPSKPPEEAPPVPWDGKPLEQLEQGEEKLLLEWQGYKIPVSNLDKKLWLTLDGRRALTKRDLLVYLTKVSPYLLLHLRDRPLTLIRYPDGIYQEHFYQKHWDNPLPEFLETVRLFSEEEGDQDYLMCNNLGSLLWLGQLANIEFHTWFSRISPEPDGHHLSTEFAGSLENFENSLLNYPDFIVFDLDPYIYSGRETKGDEPELSRRGFASACQVASWLKEVLDALSLPSFVKTSGRTGLHVYVPILRQLDYDAIRSAAETIGNFLLRKHPREITMQWRVEKRTGKVFLDHNQNARGKTLASVYSPRATAEASVSVPVRWEELSQVYPTDFTILSVPDRLAKVGDLWAGILDAKCDLKRLLEGVGEK